MNDATLTEIMTSIEELKKSIVVYFENVNDKEDWDTISEITRNLLASKQMAITVLTLLYACIQASKDKEDFITTTATALDKITKLNGILEMFDGVAFKMAVTSLYEKIYGDEKSAAIIANVENKIAQLLTFVAELPVIEEAPAIVEPVAGVINNDGSVL